MIIIEIPIALLEFIAENFVGVLMVLGLAAFVFLLYFLGVIQ